MLNARRTRRYQGFDSAQIHRLPAEKVRVKWTHFNRVARLYFLGPKLLRVFGAGCFHLKSVIPFWFVCSGNPGVAGPISLELRR